VPFWFHGYSPNNPEATTAQYLLPKLGEEPEKVRVRALIVSVRFLIAQFSFF